HLSCHTPSLFLSHPPAPTDTYTLSLHDALPIFLQGAGDDLGRRRGVAVHQHDERRLGRDRVAGGVQRLRRDPAPAQRHDLAVARSEEHTSELQSRFDLVCRLLLEKKKKTYLI